MHCSPHPLPWPRNSSAATHALHVCRAQPVFSVEHLKDPFPRGGITISGGVFGYGEVSELYQWNSDLAGLPLEWPAGGQLGGVIALKQRPGRRDIVIGGFAGCAQVGDTETESGQGRRQQAAPFVAHLKDID